MRLGGFEYREVGTNGVTLHVAVAGHGPAVVLLHGFPQSHLAWRHVAATLATDHTVVCPDLRGYGRSSKPNPSSSAAEYSKQAMALDIVGLMEVLGHRRFHLVGHDRGAQVAFRLGLDHPELVRTLTLLGQVPNVDLWDSLAGLAGLLNWHHAFLAQPPSLAEQLIAARPGAFFGHFFDTWAGVPEALPADVRAAYLADLSTMDAIRAVCADHRAGALVDEGQDAADRTAGRQLPMPTLAMWSDPADRPPPVDPGRVWASWAHDLRTQVVAGGHFIPEEQPATVTQAIADLVAERP